MFRNLHFFGGIDGAKQPQDYGVNANLGMRLHFNWGIPVLPEYGIGFQLGAATEWSGNAVRVYELLGLNDERTQNYITFGAFQRTESGFGWAIVYDNLYQESFDHVHLSQWRGRLSWQIDDSSEIGATVNLRGFDDTAQFGAATVRLRSIDQGSIYYRHTFESGVEGTVWLGMAGEHGESNAAFGPATPKDRSFIYGADFFAPLNEYLAIYGETNLMMPADTGTVDAYLGVAWYPYGGAKRARKSRFAPMLPVAADTSFSVDLLP